MKKCPQCGKEFETTNTLCPYDGAVLKKADDALLGTTLADKYRIEERLSDGGMGTVYRGTHILMDKTVAVKVLHPTLAADEKIVARFSREARAASRISHPHALSVTDFGESDNGIVFLVMEYLQGSTLKDVIRQDGPLPLSRAVEIMRQVSSALDAAHAQGVVHRDLKSDNIMLVDLDSHSDWAKVLDFGIAKIQEPLGQDPALTAPNLIIGTPQYMSPEQCSQSQDIDHRTDIYSLGVILFEMLSGHVPFSGESPTAIMMKHLQEAPPSILDERKDLPEAVNMVISKAMAKVPSSRFETPGLFAEALEAAASTSLSEERVDPAALTDPNHGRETDRILISTSPSTDAVDRPEDEPDESTLVNTLGQRRAADITPPVLQAEQVRGDSGLNPWKVIVPTIVGLLVIFAVVYAITGRTKTDANINNAQSPLAADPNGQPVQSAKPATGNAEKGIAATVPTVSTQPSPAAPAGSTANRNAGDGARPSNENAGAADNRNRRRNANNSNKEENATEEEEPAEPGPSPSSERNSNRHVTPPPPLPKNSNEDGDEPPPPAPRKKSPVPKPTEAPSSNDSTGTPGAFPPG
jgi:eukaryotic-like serine/threonine-protein kinase